MTKENELLFIICMTKGKLQLTYLVSKFDECIAAKFWNMSKNVTLGILRMDYVYLWNDEKENARMIV